MDEFSTEVQNVPQKAKKVRELPKITTGDTHASSESLF